MPVHFFQEDLFFLPEDRPVLRKWIAKCAKQHAATVGQLNYIFCSDEYLLNINREYLNHDYYTDIITFDTAEPGSKKIAADIFISIDRIRENAYYLGIPFRKELHRVLIHGVLHLLGYADKKKADQERMRQAENAQLTALEALINAA